MEPLMRLRDQMIQATEKLALWLLHFLRWAPNSERIAQRFADSAWAEIGVGHWRWAMFWGKCSVALHPAQPWGLTVLALAHVRRGDLAAALALTESAAPVVQANLRASEALGDVALELERLDLAEATYLQVLRVRPHDPRLLAKLAVAIRDQSRLDEAAVLLTRANELDPEDDYTLAALGETRVRQGNWQSGRDLLARSVEITPGLARSHYYLAVALAGLATTSGDRGPWRDALIAASQALALEPGNVEYRRFVDALTKSVRVREEDQSPG